MERTITIERGDIMNDNALRKLRDILGPEAREAKCTEGLVECLEGCWEHITDATDQKMRSWKLDRIEDITWDPAILNSAL